MLAWFRQWQASQGVHLQIKLRHVASVHGVVAAVVRARRHFIDDQAAMFGAVIDDEKLHTQHTHVVDVMCY